VSEPESEKKNFFCKLHQP